MKVLQVLLFCVISFVFAQKRNSRLCRSVLTVDITNGTKIAKNIIHDNVTYSPKDFYVEDNKILGCLCNIKQCIRKCCPYGEGHNGTTCVSSSHPLTTNFSIHTHMQKDKMDTPTEFKHVIGHDCPLHSYALDAENYAEDEHYLQHDGSLYMPNHDKTVTDYRLQHEFCVDVNVSSDKNQYITVLCFNSPPVEPQKLYSIGMLISMPFLLGTLLVYACVPDMQNIHGRCLICYVVSLLVAYLFLVSLQLNYTKTDSDFCLIAPFIIYFAFMASFMWLHVMCLDIWWTFSGLRGYRGSVKKSEQKRFLLYSLYAWGVPVLMLSVTLGLQFAKDLPDWVITPQIGVSKCWFPNDKTIGVYFYGPILLIIVVNFFLFAYTTYKIWSVQKTTDQSMKNESQRHGSETDKQRLKLYLKLMFVFGMNWLMEIISWLVDGPQWVWYVTDMCNALYGVFIFFIFVCKPNVWKLVRKRYHVMMGRQNHAKTLAATSSTASTGLSTASTANATRDSFALTSSTA